VFFYAADILEGLPERASAKQWALMPSPNGQTALQARRVPADSTPVRQGHTTKHEALYGRLNKRRDPYLIIQYRMI
jgi:hypothetical protein